MANEIQEFRLNKGQTWTAVVEQTTSGAPAADVILQFKRATPLTHAEIDDLLEYIRQAALKTYLPFNVVP